MKNILNNLPVLVLTLFFATSGFAGDKQSIALAVKIIRDVSRTGENADWVKTQKGDILNSGDEVKTGDKSIAIVKFKDNSLLRVRESSELKVVGEVKEGKLSKTVQLVRGEFGFDIQKQDDEKFIISTPTSVAAIRGTQGIISHSDNGDNLTVVEGLIDFLNTLSNQHIDVAAGKTAVSNANGQITIHDTTPEENTAAHTALNSALGKGQEQQLDIEVKDPQGVKKKLRIHYKK